MLEVITWGLASSWIVFKAMNQETKAAMLPPAGVSQLSEARELKRDHRDIFVEGINE